jgi:hypothetical protein
VRTLPVELRFFAMVGEWVSGPTSIGLIRPTGASGWVGPENAVPDKPCFSERWKLKDFNLPVETFSWERPPLFDMVKCKC